MPFIPYSRQEISEDDIRAVTDVLKSEFLTQGPAIVRFEDAFAERHRVQHAIAVSNATAALHIGCLALDVGPGARVWTSPNSFVASANCALYCGAQVDFVDIDPVTRNLSIASLEERLQVAASRGTLPQVLIPVHFAGLPCDLRQMRALADRYGFRILEDASHAVGASYEHRPIGSAYADVSVFSFHAVKIVTTAEGGMVTTQDAKVAAKLRMLRTHGITREPHALRNGGEGAWYYEQQVLGYNYRITDVQAALGWSQLKRLDDMHMQRAAAADRYDALLSDLPLILPKRFDDRVSAWHLYVIELDRARTDRNRAQVFAQLRTAGIGANVHYIPIHMQPYYAQLGFRQGDFPACERYYSGAITIPLFPALTVAQQQFVAATLRTALS